MVSTRKRSKKKEDYSFVAQSTISVRQEMLLNNLCEFKWDAYPSNEHPLPDNLFHPPTVNWLNWDRIARFEKLGTGDS